MNSQTRNKNYKQGSSGLRCDRSGWAGGRYQGQWKGSRWYRFQAPAGTRLLEKPPKFSSTSEGTCGTHYTGWVNGHHPTNPGDLVVRKICFKTSGSQNCGYKGQRTVKIRHCGSYFVYYLTDTPSCYLRYCAE